MKSLLFPWNLRAFLGFCALALAGCGSGNSKDDNASTQSSYKYSLDDNGCKTEKTLTSKQAYCDTLEDATANSGCALAERKTLFQRDCGSDFKESNPLNP